MSNKTYKHKRVKILNNLYHEFENDLIENIDIFVENQMNISGNMFGSDKFS